MRRYIKDCILDTELRIYAPRSRLDQQLKMDRFLQITREAAIVAFVIALALAPVLDIIVGKAIFLLCSLWITTGKHYKLFDQYMVERLSRKYVQWGILIAIATEVAGVFGVRAHGAPVLNVLSLIWTGVVPVAIIFHLIYRNEYVKALCEDPAVKLLVTVAMLVATWFSHADAASTITAQMGIDSSRFTSAVAATTFFGILRFMSVAVSAAAGLFFLLAICLTFTAPSPDRGRKSGLVERLQETKPRFLPYCFWLAAIVAAVPELILGGSNLTNAMSARIAYTYDLSDPGICRESKQADGRVLILIDNHKRAILYTANEPPQIPVSFMKWDQLKAILPIQKKEIDCTR